MPQVGEIVLAAFPFTDLSGSKRRPCLVLAEAESRGDFVCAFATTAAPARFTQFGVLVAPSHPQWHQIRLKGSSVVRADKLCTLNSCLMSGRVGVLPIGLFMAVRQELKRLLGL